MRQSYTTQNGCSGTAGRAQWSLTEARVYVRHDMSGGCMHWLSGWRAYQTLHAMPGGCMHWLSGSEPIKRSNRGTHVWGKRRRASFFMPMSMMTLHFCGAGRRVVKESSESIEFPLRNADLRDADLRYAELRNDDLRNLLYMIYNPTPSSSMLALYLAPPDVSNAKMYTLPQVLLQLQIDAWFRQIMFPFGTHRNFRLPGPRPLSRYASISCQWRNTLAEVVGCRWNMGAHDFRGATF
nr:hypothetical protein CFP56_16704 [Quercus suber]